TDFKADMEQDKPMDRLVCGDVGYGKTEIAIRAAFKAAMDSKQVAVLVPTTILAQQHFETFSQRLANFPVKVDLLSRFRSSGQQKKTVEALKRGDVDIIVGTHRLLSPDVEFKDLGLIVVDEEQRFGVKNKEKLKEMKRGVDVLTLTATPIPRTLHQTLVGIRGISNIETAPINRLPILTEIIDWDEDRIYTAITREMDRGGQVFFVHNRVQTIDEIYQLVKKIVPKARIAIGHGQMNEHQLEQVMIDFKQHKYDILLATMIIENGLDIPNANTILINHAERFGLAQLYQLRGRVGRSDHQAYAYLIAPKMHQMTSIALKRLHAIEEFSELGSGIKISMRDLEIRGAGSLLGHQQSGHIEAVGYEMYLEILEETVQELKEKQSELIKESKSVKSSDTQFEVDIDSLLPDSYIHNPHERMNLYHRLAKCKNQQETDELVDEITDRFGKAPAAAHALFEMFRLRNIASQLMIAKIAIRKLNMNLQFSDEISENEQLIQNVITKFMNQNQVQVNFTQTKGFGVNVPLKGDVKGLDKVQFAKMFLESINE
ncbi:MAG: DEAD/DEAH box helicase, partial [Calditrichaeota bacterium]|nr:DEAD/DEAH box helicase [Calditrichota bacterium]